MIVPATLVSILPCELRETKPGNPGSFVMPAVPKGEVEVLVLRSADAPYYVDYERGSIKMHGDPELVLKSVVEDYIRATIYVTVDAHPGLFYVLGDKTQADIKKDHRVELENANRKQNNWFEKLVKAADDTWQRVRRHNVISDQHRIAAHRLGLKREWADILAPSDTVECEYCTTLISGKAVVCPQCRMPQEAAMLRLPEVARNIIRKSVAKET